MKRFLLFTLVIGLFAVQADAAMWHLDKPTALTFTTFKSDDLLSTISIDVYDGIDSTIRGSAYDGAFGPMSGQVGFTAEIGDGSDTGILATATVYTSSPGLDGDYDEGIKSYFENDDQSYWSVQLFYTTGNATVGSDGVVILNSGAEYTSGDFVQLWASESTWLSIPDSVDLGDITNIGFRVRGIMGPIDIDYPSKEDKFHVSLVSVEQTCSLEVEKTACVITPGGNQCYKGNKVKSMILEYTGQGCGASSHSQELTKVTCSGDLGGAEPVTIVVTSKKGDKQWGYALDVPIGGHVEVDAANAGKDTLDAETIVTIIDESSAESSADVEEVKFHTSCSQPLGVGDQFGSMRLISLTTTEGGTVGSDTCITEIPATGADVEYTYTVTNTGATPVTNVTVVDDVFGSVPGSPIASIAAGESKVLTLTAFLSDETTNTVVVTADEGCSAQATATITKAPPEPEECTTKVQAMLLKYIGPTVPGPVTVTIKADKFKDDLVSYTFGGNLDPDTILSLPAENDWTIDATAHTTTDKKGNVKQCVELGAKTEISIKGVKEVIHTSCSTPFVSDQPAPLDNPKGDPSLNWFVVDFQQK